MSNENIFKEIAIEDNIQYYCALNIDVNTYNEICIEDKKADFRSQALFFDPSFQRIYGSWDSKKKSKYIKSVFMGTTYTPIILTDIHEEHKKDNLKYSCLDGQHRTTVICEFIDNKFGLNVEMDFGNGNRKYKNVFFKDLSKKDQKRFLKSKITIQTVITKRPHEEIFININDGASLNPQEKRNAVKCFMAKWSRKCYEDYKDNVFERLSGVRSKLERMSAHEFVSRLYKFLSGIPKEVDDKRKFYDLNNSSIDDLYRKNRVIDERITDYIHGDLLPSLIAPSNYLRSDKNKVIQKSDFWAFSIIHSILTLQENKEYGDISESFSSMDFWSFCVEINRRLISRSKRKEAEMEQKYADNPDSIFEPRPSYYHENITRAHIGPNAKLLYEEIFKELNGDVHASIKHFIAQERRKTLAIA